MFTYFAIGVSVELAWFIFGIIRKTLSVKHIKGLDMWVGFIFGSIFGSIFNIAVWPITVVVNIVASYNIDQLKEEP